ncbi:polysaccharide export protein [Sphingomonas sp. MA1305]|uniref:polysaccharide biosynthesis/export family protein n=1 Tax=Sphingomonas sp. MA1305 TaxID=2479204 RepID=UPI0018DFE3E7|nr:polysaccharide biosynthesis/export family protein [Sphingomonas sp. MA1305]MBI0477174.1 polysaccharide export protein [Sphingomonas sp. MA1305]
MRVLPYFAMLTLLVIGGCAREKFEGRPGLQMVENSTLPAPTRADLVQLQRPYVIGPADRVAIDVYGVPELSRTVQVDTNGRISLPLAGDIEAAGNTPAQLAGLIAASLRQRYVRDPQVTVNVDTVNQMVTIDGQVAKPGLYPISGQMTLMRVVATAEGATQYADLNYIVVYRQVNGTQYAALYDLRAIRDGIYPDPQIYPNDVVYVGESRGRRLFSDIIASSALLSAPLIAILR